jgi:hypothetical protein
MPRKAKVVEPEKEKKPRAPKRVVLTESESERDDEPKFKDGLTIEAIKQTDVARLNAQYSLLKNIESQLRRLRKNGDDKKLIDDMAENLKAQKSAFKKSARSVLSIYGQGIQGRVKIDDIIDAIKVL